MIEGPGFLLTIAAFLLVIGPLVFVHEMGHYLVGRWCGVHAEAFSIGFGREVAGFTDARGTRWKFGWLPLGGYVRFAGDMNPASQPDAAWLALPPAERARSFQSKPVWQRAAIVAAGPAINFLLAIVILAGFAWAYGDSRTPPVVGALARGGAAAEAGIRPGDRIVSLGGRSMDSFADIARFAQLRPDERVEVGVQRDGSTRTLPLTIRRVEERNAFGTRFPVGRLGIMPVRNLVEVTPVSLVDAPAVAVRRTGEILRMMVDSIGQIVTGRRSMQELGGPLRIAQASGQQFTLGLEPFVLLIALVSINLGFINLLPVPMLDGGHLLFYAIEAVRRRPADPRMVEWAFRGGLAALLMLMIFVTINDLGAFGVWRGLAGLIG